MKNEPDETSVSSGFDIKDRSAWLLLWSLKGIGSQTFFKLLEAFETPKKALAASQSALQNAGLSSRLAETICSAETATIQKDLAWLKADDCHLITWADDDYPPLLREISDPPPLLYLRGNRSILGSLQLAVVGARNATTPALQTARAFSKTFNQYGFTVTSGLAYGVDQAAHWGALDDSGATIAVAATGLDRVYPARHKALAEKILTQGAIVSEFPIGTQPKPGYFPRRNRIISGLSLGVLVVEASIKSGTLVTARLAMEQGREVFAIPGSIHNPLTKGCHLLIKQGAKLVETAEDVLEELGALAQTFTVENKTECTATNDLSVEYLQLLEKLPFDPISVDNLVEQTHFTAEEISSMLLVLELQGLVSSAPGGLFNRCATET